jgi:hypothetical protein
MFDQINNTSAARYKHDEDNPSIIINFALDEGLINISSVEHKGKVHLLFKMLF